MTHPTDSGGTEGPGSAGRAGPASAAPGVGTVETAGETTGPGRRVFITAAEVSGDRHAAEFVLALRQLDPRARAEGLGGPALARAGAVLHHETVGGAAMLLHGLRRAGEMLRLLKWTRRHYAAGRPDLHVCVDSSGVNLHFAKLARSFGVPVLYYIAPQLWASRPGRIKRVRQSVDRVACILPFEEEYYRSRGVAATFVGHPLFDELPADRAAILAARRERFAGEDAAGGRFAARPPVVGIIPGSRRSEVRANLPHLLEVAGRIRAAFPGAKFLIPTTPAVHVTAALLVGMWKEENMLSWSTEDSKSAFEVEYEKFDDFIPRCDLCLCKSGTSTLHVAAYGVPMIVVYRLGRLAWHLAGRWLIHTPKIALVNILAGNVDLVPEYIPWYGSNQPVADHAIQLLRHPERLDAQRDKLLELVATLDRQGASMNVARIALEMMNPGMRRR